MRTGNYQDMRTAAINRFLFIGPAVIMLAWFVAGQWDLAGAETRVWLQFTGVVGLASLVPMPGTSRSLAAFRARAQWWGWVVVFGLVVTS